MQSCLKRCRKPRVFTALPYFVNISNNKPPDGLERSPTLPTAAEGTGKGARLPSARLPPPSCPVAGKSSGDMATGVRHSNCSSSTGTTCNVSGNGNGNGNAAAGGSSACNRAAQATVPLSPANTAASDSVPSVLAAAATAAAAAASRPTPTIAGAASLSGKATPPTLANSPRTTPMPSPVPSPLRASKLSSSSAALPPQLQQSQLSSRASSTPAFLSPLAASAGTDPEVHETSPRKLANHYSIPLASSVSSMIDYRIGRYSQRCCSHLLSVIRRPSFWSKSLASHRPGCCVDREVAPRRITCLLFFSVAWPCLAYESRLPSRPGDSLFRLQVTIYSVVVHATLQLPSLRFTVAFGCFIHLLFGRYVSFRCGTHRSGGSP